MQWNYFGNEHGKGRWDGAGVHIKDVFRAEHDKPLGVHFHNASYVVNFSQGHFNRYYDGYSHVRRDVQHFFYDVKLEMLIMLTNLMPILLQTHITCIKYIVWGWIRFHYKYEICLISIGFTQMVEMVHVTM